MTDPNRRIPVSGLVTGQAFADDADAEVSNLWDKVTLPLTSVSGANSIIASVSPTPTAYVQGQRFGFVAASSNTGSVTINIAGLGATEIFNVDNSSLSSGTILADSYYEIVHDGDAFRLVGVVQQVNGLTEVAVFRYYASDNSHGGTTVAGPTQIYPLNGEVYNGISGATLSSQTITLPAGLYDIDAVVIISNTQGKLLLWNATAGEYVSTVVSPQAGVTGATAYVPYHLTGALELTSTTQIQLHYDVTVAVNTTGLGARYAGLTTDEEYGVITIRRINPFTEGMNSVDKLGINTSSDDTEKLIVQADGTRFEALPVASGGTGSQTHTQLTENGGGLRYRVSEELVTLSGATTDGTVTLSSGSVILGFSMRVVTVVTGASSITAGTSATAAEFGTGIAVAAGTTASAMLNDGLRSASNVIRFTAAGGNFAGGTVRYVVAWLEMVAPES